MGGSFDVASMPEFMIVHEYIKDMPANLERGDLLYTQNIAAYSVASSTPFKGFPPAKVVHINR